MITMSAIWDRTAEVLRGRGGMLAGIAALLLFLPAVVQNAAAAHAAGAGAGPAGWAALVGLVAAAINVWGNLSLVAAASDPAVDGRAAMGAGGRRLPLAIGLSLLIVLLFVVLAIPPLVLLASKVNLQAIAAGGAARLTTPPPAGLLVGVLAYFMVLAAFGIWLSARLALFAPVLVNERRGMGSFARSFELTRGLAWRIIGVLLLFGILVGVAASAVRAVAGIVARLLGAGVSTADFVAGVAVAVVVAGATVVSATFVAQLWRVASGREAARAFE